MTDKDFTLSWDEDKLIVTHPLLVRQERYIHSPNEEAKRWIAAAYLAGARDTMEIIKRIKL